MQVSPAGPRFACGSTGSGSATWETTVPSVKGFTNCGSITAQATASILPSTAAGSCSCCSVATSHHRTVTLRKRSNTGGTIRGEASMAKTTTSYQKDLIEALKDPC